MRGERAGNLSASKEPTAAGAVIEGDFPRGQMLGQPGQSTAKLYTANVQGNTHTIRCSVNWGGQFLVLSQGTQKGRSRLAWLRFLYNLTVIPLIIEGVIQVESNAAPVCKDLANRIYRGSAGKALVLLDHSTRPRKRRCGLSVVLKDFNFIVQMLQFSG